MTITEIKLAGAFDPETGNPRLFARICPGPADTQLTVTFMPPTPLPAEPLREHIVDATCREDIFSMAQCIQFHLDGYKGTNSEIHDYYRFLQYFEH